MRITILRNILLVMLVTVISVFSTAYSNLKYDKPINAEEFSPIIRGSVNYRNQTVEFINVMGCVTLDQVVVQKGIQIQGRASINNSHLSDLKVKGCAQIFYSTVNGPVIVRGKLKTKQVNFQNEVRIHGSLHAMHSNFRGGVIVSSTKIVLEGVHMHDLYVPLIKKKSYIGLFGKKYLLKTKILPQVVTLSANTIIKGDITFESGKGVVVLNKGCKIEGKIIGSSRIYKFINNFLKYEIFNYWSG